MSETIGDDIGYVELDAAIDAALTAALKPAAGSGA
jgi:hypothetical protein